MAHEDALDWDPEVVLSGSEIAEDSPTTGGSKRGSARKPRRPIAQAVAALFDGTAPKLKIEKLPEADWVTQQPAKASRRSAPGVSMFARPTIRRSPRRASPNSCIPASQAFGTGQHETTAGCLAMLTAMKARGVVARNLADIGTGTGLLAFAALDLWPRALATASDIDPVCAGWSRRMRRSTDCAWAPGRASWR